MVPYIDEIAQPGMKVVFLIGFCPEMASKTPRHSLGLRFLEDVRLEEEDKTELGSGNVCATQSMEEQRLAVEHKVFLALEAWIKRGIEITVDVYMSSLKKAIKSYTSKGDVNLIVMRARRKRMMMDFIYKTFPILRMFKHPTFAPVLVLHPTQAV
jgi:hypothetical protein